MNDQGCVVVTGGGSGIGRACALRLAGSCLPVAVLDQDGDTGGETLAEIEKDGGAGLAFALDVTDDDAVAGAVRDTVAAFGPPRVLVNCAGMGVRKDLLGTSVAEWRRVVDVNLTGYFILLRHVVPPMRDSGGGSIVQIASIAGHIGYGYPSYTAAKGGVLAMTRQLAGELAPDRIRINSVSPGVVRTGLNRDTLSQQTIRDATLGNIPVGRLGDPGDIAGAVAFLAGPDAEFVTGADLVVDGGMISRIHWGQVGERFGNFHAER
ncbi:NAD(P)-dependent dehydrogenase (short-subunit alcohol dehydrogenase family) [Prauserella shujinwangii]|uniref:NAD(P)-dependent dehydrogenase (Short-subunit alcohol dehydrogenase family) n=1 Tax=Prauserella shujinwangii TaxID=1453103 RepID=A0A2T0M1K8_9PSEU|nr:SDR family NAD(P)-dependent oxidoreductase [Prauserella shujinwangii]PRX50463.1 NAD(P)-dependent dehydrogenase (short-subunit alcohol dehydrogenase family) [Prauserella shujinwangii]